MSDIRLVNVVPIVNGWNDAAKKNLEEAKTLMASGNHLDYNKGVVKESVANLVSGFADDLMKAPAVDTESLQPQWISVKDRLPDADEGDDFLAVSKNGNFVFEAYFVRDCGRGKNLWHDGCGNFYEVTHWMPLPEPPKEEYNA